MQALPGTCFNFLQHTIIRAHKRRRVHPSKRGRGVGGGAGTNAAYFPAEVLYGIGENSLSFDICANPIVHERFPKPPHVKDKRPQIQGTVAGQHVTQVRKILQSPLCEGRLERLLDTIRASTEWIDHERAVEGKKKKKDGTLASSCFGLPTSSNTLPPPKCMAPLPRYTAPLHL